MNPIRCQDKNEFDSICKAIEVADLKECTVKIEDHHLGYFPCVSKKQNYHFSNSNKIAKEIALKVINFFEVNEKFLSGTSELVYQLKEVSDCNEDLKNRFFKLFKKSIEMDLNSEKEEKIFEEATRKANAKAEKILEEAAATGKLAQETSEKAACLIEQAKKNAALILQKATSAKEKLLIEISDLEKQKEEKCNTLFTCRDGHVFTNFKTIMDVPLFKADFNFSGETGLTKKQKQTFPSLLYGFQFNYSKKTICVLLAYLEKKQSLEETHPSEKECESIVCKKVIDHLGSNALYELYCVAKHMQIELLVRYCAKLLSEKLSGTEWLLPLIMTDEISSALIQAALEQVAHNFSELSKDPLFLSIQKEFLIELLKRDDLQIDREAELWKSVLQWAEATSHRKKEEMRLILLTPIRKSSILDQIRFEHFSKQEFENLVMSLNLIGEKSVLSCLKAHFSGKRAIRYCSIDGIFGKKEWETYFGDVGKVPPLPKGIVNILEGPCPFDGTKKVKETHILALVPKTVNGKPLSLNELGRIVEAPKKGNRSHYRYRGPSTFTAHGDVKIEESYWVLMKKDVLDGTRNQPFEQQQNMLVEHLQRLNIPYQIPKAIEVAVCLFMEYVKNENRLLNDAPSTYTRCQEVANNYPVIVGGFAAGGPRVSFDDGGAHARAGLVPLRKF